MCVNQIQAPEMTSLIIELTYIVLLHRWAHFNIEPILQKHDCLGLSIERGADKLGGE
jgi:hypothetical protein